MTSNDRQLRRAQRAALRIQSERLKLQQFRNGLTDHEAETLLREIMETNKELHELRQTNNELHANMRNNKELRAIRKTNEALRTTRRATKERRDRARGSKETGSPEDSS